MKINRIDIGAFGKLEDFTLLLREGIQVFYGENEEGKSTIMAFISMMFYSKQENSQDIFRNPRRKYMPWSGRTMEGSISFLWENQEYHLSKQFADTPSKDIVTLTNLTLGQPISLGKEEVGEYFFGFNLSTFQRSSFIGQIGPVATGKKGMEEISDKLIYNLLTTANEHTSQQEVFSRLEKAKYELKSKREDRGLLVDAQQDLFTLLRKLKDAEEEIENQQEAQKKYHLLIRVYHLISTLST